MVSVKDSKPLLLCLAHLPPPINGVTVMGEQVVNSPRLNSHFNLEVLPLKSAASIADIGRLRPAKALRVVALAGQLVRHCLMNRPDLIYFTLTPNGAAFYRDLLYVAIMKLFRIRRVFHLHGKGVAQATAGKVSRALYLWAFRGAYVILLSPSLYKDCARVVRRKQCHFLANGISDPWRSGENRSHDIDDGVPRILYFSNLVVNKGLFVLLEALVLLRERGLAFRATFVGAWESAVVEEAFHQFVRENCLIDVVELCGPQYGDDKLRTYAGADIMAFPTYNDTYPLVVLEAMSHGLPVVSTLEGAISEMVAEGETGFLVPRHDTHALADRLALLITNPVLRMRLGSAGRLRYCACFTTDIFTSNLLAILEKCLADAATRSTNGYTDKRKRFPANS